MKINLLNKNNVFLCELKIKNVAPFIFYYGNLYQRVLETNNYKQVQYLEIF